MRGFSIGIGNSLRHQKSRHVRRTKAIYSYGLVGGWKAYGRSNTEDPATREILPDYSGNGRDIRLYNFAFSGMSGYGGYALPPDKLIERTVTKELTVTPFGIDVTLSPKKEGEVASVYCTYIRTSDLVVGIPVRIKAGSYGARVYVEGSRPLPSNHILKLSEGETGEFTISQADIDAGYSLVYVGPLVNMNFGESTTITFLPTYPGGLVSDGVDDYGRCVKKFSLPDDFSVVAIRRIISGNSASLVNKGQASGAFLFEGLVSDGTISNYSYGQITYSRTCPALFSYLTTTSYNGEKVTAGTAVDDDAKLLVLFTSSNKYQNTVLYDLRIYDHSLSEEELETVRDEMMSDYEKATGGGYR